MPKHKQPTPEELKAQEEAAIKAAEDEESDKETPEDKEAREAEEEEARAKAEAEGEDEQDKEDEDEDDQAEPSEEEKEALRQKLEDEKKKSSASARENQKIYAKNRVLNQAVADAEGVPEPTEQELTKEYPEWDVMSDIEKTLAKETIVSRNWRKVISEAKEQATKIEKWNESVGVFVDDPTTLNDNPELEGKTEEFKAFATEEANNSVPFKILISAFLHDKGTAQKSNKGKMFEKGLGGSNEKPTPKDGTISLDEARKLRETDYSKWKELLVAGRIKSDL